MNFASAVSSLDETYRKQIHYLIVMTEMLAPICSFTVQYNYNRYLDQTWLSDPKDLSIFFGGALAWKGGTGSLDLKLHHDSVL